MSTEQVNSKTQWREAMTVLDQVLTDVESIDVDYVLENLVTTADICERVGWTSHNAVSNLRSRNTGFPEPVKSFGGYGNLWWWPDVDQWLADRNRTRAPRERKRAS